MEVRITYQNMISQEMIFQLIKGSALGALEGKPEWVAKIVEEVNGCCYTYVCHYVLTDFPLQTIYVMLIEDVN